MTALEVCIIAAVVVAFGLVSRRLEGTPVTMPMVFVVAGIITEATGIVDVGIESESVALLAEITLALILFSDASRIDAICLRREVGLPARLLGIGLPLSILLGTGIVALLLPSLGIWQAALVAAILAPTDAALGQAVVEDHSVPQRVRQSLNVESGLNDGIVLPAVFLFAALAAGEAATSGFWVRFAAQQIGVGLLIGIAVGVLGAFAIETATRHQWVDGINAQLATLAFAVLALAGATAAGGNGFIAAFVAGIVFGTRSDRSTSSVEYTEDSSRLLTALSFFVFGNVVVPEAATSLPVGVALCVIASLTIGRMVPVAIATWTARPDWRTVAFLGWFGPRGIASIVFVLIVAEEATGPEADAVLSIVTWTVLASIFLHGTTAGPLARRYGAWFEDMGDDHDTMIESGPATVHRLRLGSPTTPMEQQ